MKKFKNSCIVLLLALLTTSCGDNGKRDHLVFYVWGDNSEIASYEKIAADFEKETSIRVEVRPSTSDYYDSLNISFSSAQNAPDIFFTESGQFLSHLASKRLMNLTPYIENGELNVTTESRPDGDIELWDVNDAYRYNGSEIGQGDYYALIKDWSPDFVLWYNKAHIDEYNTEHNLTEGDPEFMQYPSQDVPMTWGQFLDYSHKLRKENRYGTMLDRVPYKHLMEWIQMTGSSTWKDGNLEFNSEDEGVKEAFQFFFDLQVGDKASAPKIGPTGVGSGEAFANGNLSFAFFGNWAYSTYHWDSVPFEIGYCPAPVPDKGRALTENDIYAGSSGMISLAVNAKTTLPDEAIKFLNYYMTKGNQYMATKGFNIPGNRKIAESDDYKHPEDSTLAKINQYFLNIATSYTHPLVYNKAVSQDTVEEIMGKHISNYLSAPNGQINSVLQSIAQDIKKEL